MSVHLFKRAGAGQYCLSLDPTGTNIPAPMNGDTWIYIKALTRRELRGPRGQGRHERARAGRIRSDRRLV